MACLHHLHAIDATPTKSLFSTLRPHRNVSRGRGASGGSFASDSKCPENFSLSPLAMRWRRRASRRFWPASCRPHLRLSHTPSPRLAGRRRRAVVELRVASHPFGILAEPRLEGALAGLLLLPRLGLARAPRRVPPLASYKFLEVDRGPADGLLLWFRRRPVCCPVFTPSTQRHRRVSRSGTRDTHGGGGGCAAKRSVTSTDVQARACFMCAATPLTCV